MGLELQGLVVLEKLNATNTSTTKKGQIVQISPLPNPGILLHLIDGPSQMICFSQWSVKECDGHQI